MNKYHLRFRERERERERNKSQTFGMSIWPENVKMTRSKGFTTQSLRRLQLVIVRKPDPVCQNNDRKYDTCLFTFGIFYPNKN